MDLGELLTDSRGFLGWVVDWYDRRPLLELAGTIETAGGAHRVAIFAVDVTHGFCSEGPLSSQRVGRLVDPIVQLSELAHRLGIRLFVLPSTQCGRHP